VKIKNTIIVIPMATRHELYVFIGGKGTNRS